MGLKKRNEKYKTEDIIVITIEKVCYTRVILALIF